MDQEQYETRGYLLEDFRLFHLRDTQMESVDWHYHNFHKLIFFLSGHASYDIEGQCYTLEPGNIVLVGRGDIHRPVVEPEIAYERVIVYLSPEFLRTQSTPDCNLETCFELARRQFQFVVRPAARSAHWQKLVQNLERTLETGGFGGALLCRSILLQLLIELGRGMMDHNLSYVETSQYDPKTVEILKYINAHMTEQISIDDLSKQFFISRFYMMRKFRDETGHTIHSYLNGKRLMLARGMIADGMPVNEVCFRCGFQDYSTFTRAYKRTFGHTPTQGIEELPPVAE